MDIPVSRLNQRMALQLPAELPLGLVFVVGEVQLPAAADFATDSRSGDFFLADHGYRLPCRLSKRAAAEFRLEQGDMVRAGGHLVFEPALAAYYLLARDIERLDGFRPAAQPLTAIIADNSRRERAASLAPAELPPWVQRMAPPEVQPQPADDRFVDDGPPGGLAAASLGAAAPPLSDDWELLVDAEAAVAYPDAEPALAGLSDELIAFLSQAMDSQVEVEITPEILADLNTTGKTERLSPEVLNALDELEASVDREDDGQSPRPPVATWPDEDSGAGGAEERQPPDQALSPADVAEALASATPGNTPEPASQPQAATANKRQPAVAAKSDDLVPWYVALLIIVMVVIILAALFYLAQYTGNLPAGLSLELPQDLPFLN